jgi:hypothetical protein
MSWFNQVSDILKQYSGAAPSAPPPNAQADFAKVAEQAPPSVISSGLTEAFRSQSTPPFAEMVSSLFGQSDPGQRAGILNHLLAAAGPAALSGGLLGSLMGASGTSASAASGTSATAGAPGSPTTVTPEQAKQISPDAVRQLAEHAEARDPSVVERAGEFYAKHPTLVQGLGTAALALIIRNISRPH